MKAKLPRSSVSTLEYFDKFNYPLTRAELTYWQHDTNSHDSPKRSISSSDGYYFLQGRQKLIKLRESRNRYSLAKWPVAHRVGEYLSRIPTIQAIFVTGSLAMNNSDRYDDIDLMIITLPNSLWFTRVFVVLLLKWKGLRRDPGLPEHSSTRVSNKICDNLYLDMNHLAMDKRNLYTSHEVLQAKPIFDHGNTYHLFLKSNSWTKSYLPIAYKSQTTTLKPKKIFNFQFSIFNFILWPLNLLFFLVQYLYMKPKITSEKIGLGFAFFHPHLTKIIG